MDEYLQCLMEYIGDTRVSSRLKQSAAYQEITRQASDIYDRLTALLTPEQKTELDSFCNVRDAMSDEEMKALFQEGVLLGKWMAAV